MATHPFEFYLNRIIVKHSGESAIENIIPEIIVSIYVRVRYVLRSRLLKFRNAIGASLLFLFLSLSIYKYRIFLYYIYTDIFLSTKNIAKVVFYSNNNVARDVSKYT